MDKVTPTAGDYLIADAYRDQVALNVINRDNLADLVARVRRQAEEAMRERAAKLAIAYHVAICSPKGVVPDDEFYDPALAAELQSRMDAAIRSMDVE